jgi:hypothetical protein
MTNRQSGDKMFLSAVTPPMLYNGASNSLLNRRCQVNLKKNPQTLNCSSILPANLIRLACSRNKRWFCQYHWLCECSHLEGDADQRGKMVKKNYKTSPINLAVTGGKGNREFHGKTTCSNLKYSSIATVPG